MKADPTEVRAARALERLAVAAGEMVVFAKKNMKLQEVMMAFLMGKPVSKPTKKRGRR